MNNLETYNKVMAINVDIQNDFCPGGALAVNDGDQVVPVMNRVNQWVRSNNGEVIFTADWHPPKTAHFAEYGGPWPPHCIRYTAGAAFNDNLILDDVDSVAKKGQGDQDDGYSGFYASFSKDDRLYREQYTRYDSGISSVKDFVVESIGVYNYTQNKVALVVGGLATDYCVKATVLDALNAIEKDKYRRNLAVFVVQDAIRAVDVEAGDGDRAIAEMQTAGAIVVDSNELVNNRVFEVDK